MRIVRAIEGRGKRALWPCEILDLKEMQDEIARAVALAHLLLSKTRAVRDPVSGFFLLRRNVIDEINPLSPTGFKILLEVLVRGSYLSVAEVPYGFGLRKTGGSKLGVKQILSYVFMLLRLKWMGAGNCR